MQVLALVLFGFAAVLTAYNMRNLAVDLQRDSVRRAWQRRRRINRRRADRVRLRKAGYND